MFQTPNENHIYMNNSNILVDITDRVELTRMDSNQMQIDRETPVLIPYSLKYISLFETDQVESIYK